MSFINILFTTRQLECTSRDKNHTMTRTLIIVESPSKCKKIAEYAGHPCVATCGHFREIADGLRGISDRFEPTFKLINDKKSVMVNLRKTAKDCRIILATDDDREGEAIAWHLCQFLCLPVESTPRIVFHEITKTAIQEAMRNPGTINMAVVRAQQARQVLDLMVGYRISPFLWKSSALSAGRCQTPTLRLVYDNHQLDRTLNIKYRTTAIFVHVGAVLNHEFDTREEVRAFLQQTSTFSHTLQILPKTTITTPPPRPLTTSRLLQLASNVLHTSPKQTMKLCQALYQEGRITYMRTDSETYAASFCEMATAFIRTRYGAEFVGEARATDGSSPHEAIRVTDLLQTAGSRMYQLIWQATVESCMASAKSDAFPVLVSAPQGYRYEVTMEKPIFWGWKCVSPPAAGGEDALATLALYNNKTIPFEHVRSQAAARNTHAHYTEASLVKKLDELGIGRPSTYASLVATIQDRGYVTLVDVPGEERTVSEFILRRGSSQDETTVTTTFAAEKGKLVITPSGVACVDFLLLHFAPLFEYDYTQHMEEELDALAAGTTTVFDVCQRCAEDIDRLATATTTFPLADCTDNVIVFQPQGVSLRRVDPVDQTVTQVFVEKELDLARAKEGKYTVTEMLRRPPSTPVSRSALRIINADCSVREGKYGPYLFYKTADMKKPAFFPVPKAWKTASEAVVMAWITSRPSKS